jgi:hypothetical protein
VYIVKNISWSLALLCVFSIALGGSEVYKWVDENGVVHFTDRPPEDQKSTEVDIAEPLTAGEVVEAESWAETWLEEQRAKRATEKQQKKDLATERRIAAADLENKCKTAKHRLGILKTQCPVFFDGQGVLRVLCPGHSIMVYRGEPRYIDDPERASMIEHYMQVLEACNETGY